MKNAGSVFNRAANRRSFLKKGAFAASPFMTRKRVLVVDDLTPVVAALLRESFDVVGMVSDGHAALESTLKLSPDLIVLAISMPGMSGIEVS
jgi:CheY-like chemotaxis protein